MKRYEGTRQPLPVIELTFESESEHQIAVSYGLYISNMHLIVKPEFIKKKMLQ